MTLQLRDVTVTAGASTLIKDINLTVRPGQMTVVLGPNGAGKSTALAVLAGDTQPTEGKALLDGTDLRDVSLRALAARRSVVLQHAPINFALSVHEVIALSRPRFDQSDDRADAVEEYTMQSLGILPLAGRDYGTLSGGERQRVQIARALAQLRHYKEEGRAGFLLMDEPTAHLDLKHQVIALEAARDFADEGGGVLCILHDLPLAREFCDQLIMMKDGRIARSGAPHSLLTADLIAQIYDIPHQRAAQLAPA